MAFGSYERAQVAPTREASLEVSREWTEDAVRNCYRTLLLKPSLLRHLIIDRGLSQETIKKYKIGITRSGAYSIPIYNDLGELKNVRFYRREDHKKWGLKGKTNKVLFPIFGLNGAGLDGEEPLWICEGEFDALIANQHNIPAITSCSGAPSSPGTLNENRYVLGENRHFILAYDNDTPGLKAAAEIGLKTFPGRIDGMVVWPEGFKKDVSDWFLKHNGTAESLRALVHPFDKQWAARLLGEPDVIEISDAAEPEEHFDRVLPFPDVMPHDGFLGEYWRSCRHVAGYVPPQFHAAAALYALGFLMSRRIWVTQGTKRYYPNIYAFLVGPSGTGKTTATDSIEHFLRRMRAGCIAPQEFSAEKLVYRMKDNPEMAFVYSEASSLMGLLSKEYASGVYELFLTLYDCPEDYTRATVKEGIVTVKEPFVSLIGATTPRIFTSKIQYRDIQTGFLPRFTYWVYSERATSVIRPQEPSQEMVARVLGEAQEVEKTKGRLLLVGEAEEEFYAWSDSIRKSLGDEDDIAFFNRMYGNCLKFAMLLEVNDRLRSNGCITGENMRRAILLSDWLLSCSSILISKFMTGTSKFAEIDNRVLGFIEKRTASGTNASARDISKYLHLRPGEVKASLETLLFRCDVEKRIRKLSSGPTTEVYVSSRPSGPEHPKIP